MRPITAAPSAASSTLGFSTWVREAPIAPMRKKIVMYARTPTIAHRTLCSRRTGMPSVPARSALSARGAQGSADHGEAEEAHQRDEHERDDDHHEDLVAGERRGVEVERPSELAGQRDVVGLTDPPGQEERQAQQDLRDPDRRNRRDQSRCVEEPAQEQELDEHAEQDRGAETGERADEVVPVTRRDQQQCEVGRHRAHLGLREVHDAVRAIHDDEPDREQARQHSRDRAVEHDVLRRVPHRVGERDHQQRRRQRRRGPLRRSVRQDPRERGAEQHQCADRGELVTGEHDAGQAPRCARSRRCSAACA